MDNFEIEPYVTIKIRRDHMGRKAKPKPNAKELIDLYQHLTQAEMAKHYGVSTATVARWLKAEGVYKHGQAKA